MSLFVADFFSGLDGWGAAFRDRGHTVVSFDLDPRFKPNVVVDMNNVRAVNGFDVILASPPCECFSVMTIGKNWNKDRTPKTERARAALSLAWHTFSLIDRYVSWFVRPPWYVIENPRGMLRKVAPRPNDATTWYCRWGAPYAKPTDLWTNLNGGSAFGWPSCAPNAPDHPPSPRGNVTVGTQGVRRKFILGASTHEATAQRALIPYRLSLAVCLAAERDGTLPSMEEVIAVEAELKGRAA